MTESQPPKKTVITAEMIEQITQTLRVMEGQEIQEGARIRPPDTLLASARTDESDARTLWSISYTTS